MAIISELEAPDADMDATVGRPKVSDAPLHPFAADEEAPPSFSVGSGRAIDIRCFQSYDPNAEVGAKSSTHAAVKPSAKAFTGKKADGKASRKTVSSGHGIPGLWTPEVARQKELDDAMNLSLVHLNVKLPTMIELPLNQIWYLLSGKFNLKDLADRVRYKVNLEVECPMKFAADCVELSEETTMSAIATEYGGPDGFVHLFCDIAQDPLKNCWITLERKKKNVPKRACALTKQQTSQELTMNTASISAMIELVTESVPYSKFPSCKSKGNRKMSQFAKKRHMHLAMDQKSPFVQTKEGPAVRSFGTLGPSGNLQYY